MIKQQPGFREVKLNTRQNNITGLLEMENNTQVNKTNEIICILWLYEWVYW